MSLFGAFLGDINEDPMMRNHRGLMNHMDSMMMSMLHSPFGATNPQFPLGGTGFPMLGSPFPSMNALMPMGGQNDPLCMALSMPNLGGLTMPHFGGLVQSMDQMSRDPNCHMYSSSSMVTMATGADGQPEVYRTSSSTRAVPGGVRETRHSMSDSRSGSQTMNIGHHIGDRSHVIERERRNGNLQEERQEFVNLDEEEAEEFDTEFQNRAQAAMGQLGSIGYRPRQRSASNYPPRSSPLPALTSSSHQRQRRRGDRNLALTWNQSPEERQHRRDLDTRTQRHHRY